MTIKGSIIGRLETAIEEMGVGQKGYTVPWALSIEKHGRVYEVYMNLKYTIERSPGGTVRLLVKRTGPGREDYEVDLDTVGDYKFNIGKACYFGTDESDIVKIGEIGILEGLMVRER